jgi:hypothetical protein
MSTHFQNVLHERFRCYGLAACCVLGPILLAYVAFNLVVTTLVPPTVPGLAIAYAPAKPKAIMEAPAADAATAPATATKAGARKADEVIPDPVLLPVSLQVAGAYGAAMASGFLYLASVAAFLFGVVVAIQRLTFRPFVLMAAPLVVLAYLMSNASLMTAP